MITRLFVFFFLLQTTFLIAQNTTDIEIDNFSNIDNVFTEILSESSPWQLIELKKINKESGKAEETEIEPIVYHFNADHTLIIVAESYTQKGKWEIIDKKLHLIKKEGTLKETHSIIHLERKAFTLEKAPDTPEYSRISFISTED